MALFRCYLSALPTERPSLPGDDSGGQFDETGGQFNGPRRQSAAHPAAPRGSRTFGWTEPSRDKNVRGHNFTLPINRWQREQPSRTIGRTNGQTGDSAKANNNKGERRPENNKWPARWIRWRDHSEWNYRCRYSRAPLARLNRRRESGNLASVCSASFVLPDDPSSAAAAAAATATATPSQCGRGKLT